jgi:hypothetical protein
MGIGSFYLTCRSSYDVCDLKAEYCQLTPFTGFGAWQE